MFLPETDPQVSYDNLSINGKLGEILEVGPN